MKKLFILALATLLNIATYAQSATPEQARTAAVQLFQSKEKSGCHCAKTISENGENLLYIFNADNAYAVISGDLRTPAVLAYCDHQLYNDADVIAPVQMWLDYYKQQIAHLKQSAPSSPAISSQWSSLLSRNGGLRTLHAVEPLMKSHWDQGEYYNYYCPKDAEGPNGHVVTGCVATAMAQLIYYFRFPQQGTGSYAYTDANYGVQSADYGNTTYDYAAMCDEPGAINTEISKLIHHFGVGVDMAYGPDGSGMYNHSAARVLRTYFKYCPQTEYLFRDSTDLDWDSVIVSHLERAIPMYYAGWSVPDINGHGFICDGYQLMDSNYYFHFNFGWGGYGDGYFYTDALTFPSYHFNFAQELIVNAYPDTNLYEYPDSSPLTGERTLTAQAGSFGTQLPFAESHLDNMDFTWKIIPDVDNLNGITIDLDYEVAYGDTLYVWSPGTDSLSQQITADTGTLHLSWQSDRIFIRYVTDSTETGSGFWANYQTETHTFCSGTVLKTSPTGIITDGSGDSTYNPLSYCKYKIIASGYTAISLHIVNLDLQENHDFLHLYGSKVNDANYITSFTGHIEDTTFVVDKNKLIFVFESDETINGDGFAIEYAAGHTGIASQQRGVSVYPNPAADRATVQCSEPIRHITICDIAGRILQKHQPHGTSCEIHLQQLPAGVYLIRIQTDEGIQTHKLVKQ